MTLKLRILQSLDRSRGYPMREAALVTEAGYDQRVRPTADEVGTALRELEREGAVRGLTNPDLGTRWALTDQGTIRLREAGL